MWLKVHVMLYIYYTYSDIEVNLCLKVLVTHLTLGHMARGTCTCNFGIENN